MALLFGLTLLAESSSLSALRFSNPDSAEVFRFTLASDLFRHSDSLPSCHPAGKAVQNDRSGECSAMHRVLAVKIVSTFHA
jgi:hypothetical protein